MNVPTNATVAVVGGGAAGLMAAIWAARAGASVVLLEGSKSCGLKILVSGGGRCNVLPTISDPSDFFTTGSRNVLKRLFKTWRLDDIYSFFAYELEVPLVEEEDTGKVFPESQSARHVRDALVREASREGVRICIDARIESVDRLDDNFRLTGSRGGAPFVLEAQRVVLATGGKSMPKTGSDGIGYTFATGLGHSIIEPYPALVPLTSPDEELRSLTGIALPVRWRARRGGSIVEERERALLFTHRGFSGPAILDASHWVIRENAALEVSWGALDREEWLRRCQADQRMRCDLLLAESLPKRLVDLLLKRSKLQGHTRFAQLTVREIERLLASLCEFQLPVDSNEGYRKAEVTGGGVPLGEVNPSTLESRSCPGLFLCGEIFDVIGRIGGFNFLWAWVTGRLAGEYAARVPDSGS